MNLINKRTTAILSSSPVMMIATIITTIIIISSTSKSSFFSVNAAPSPLASPNQNRFLTYIGRENLNPSTFRARSCVEESTASHYFCGGALGRVTKFSISPWAHSLSSLDYSANLAGCVLTEDLSVFWCIVVNGMRVIGLAMSDLSETHSVTTTNPSGFSISGIVRLNNFLYVANDDGFQFVMRIGNIDSSPAQDSTITVPGHTDPQSMCLSGSAGSNNHKLLIDVKSADGVAEIDVSGPAATPNLAVAGFLAAENGDETRGFENGFACTETHLYATYDDSWIIRFETVPTLKRLDQIDFPRTDGESQTTRISSLRIFADGDFLLVSQRRGGHALHLVDLRTWHVIDSLPRGLTGTNGALEGLWSTAVVAIPSGTSARSLSSFDIFGTSENGVRHFQMRISNLNDITTFSPSTIVRPPRLLLNQTLDVSNAEELASCAIDSAEENLYCVTLGRTSDHPVRFTLNPLTFDRFGTSPGSTGAAGCALAEAQTAYICIFSDRNLVVYSVPALGTRFDGDLASGSFSDSFERGIAFSQIGGVGHLFLVYSSDSVIRCEITDGINCVSEVEGTLDIGSDLGGVRSCGTGDDKMYAISSDNPVLFFRFKGDAASGTFSTNAGYEAEVSTALARAGSESFECNADFAFVSDTMQNAKMVKISLTSFSVVTTLDLSVSIDNIFQAVALSHDNRYIIVSGTSQNQILVLSADTLAYLSAGPVNAFPFGKRCAPSGTHQKLFCPTVGTNLQEYDFTPYVGDTRTKTITKPLTATTSFSRTISVPSLTSSKTSTVTKSVSKSQTVVSLTSTRTRSASSSLQSLTSTVTRSRSASLQSLTRTRTLSTSSSSTPSSTLQSLTSSKTMSKSASLQSLTSTRTVTRSNSLQSLTRTASSSFTLQSLTISKTGSVSRTPQSLTSTKTISATASLQSLTNTRTATASNTLQSLTATRSVSSTSSLQSLTGTKTASASASLRSLTISKSLSKSTSFQSLTNTLSRTISSSLQSLTRTITVSTSVSHVVRSSTKTASMSQTVQSLTTTRSISSTASLQSLTVTLSSSKSATPLSLTNTKSRSSSVTLFSRSKSLTPFSVTRSASASSTKSSTITSSRSSTGSRSLQSLSVTLTLFSRSSTLSSSRTASTSATASPPPTLSKTRSRTATNTRSASLQSLTKTKTPSSSLQSLTKTKTKTSLVAPPPATTATTTTAAPGDNVINNLPPSSNIVNALVVSVPSCPSSLNSKCQIRHPQSNECRCPQNTYEQNITLLPSFAFLPSTSPTSQLIDRVGSACVRNDFVLGICTASTSERFVSSYTRFGGTTSENGICEQVNPFTNDCSCRAPSTKASLAIATGSPSSLVKKFVTFCLPSNGDLSVFWTIHPDVATTSTSSNRAETSCVSPNGNVTCECTAGASKTTFGASIFPPDSTSTDPVPGDLTFCKAKPAEPEEEVNLPVTTTGTVVGIVGGFIEGGGANAVVGIQVAALLMTLCDNNPNISTSGAKSVVVFFEYPGLDPSLGGLAFMLTLTLGVFTLHALLCLLLGFKRFATTEPIEFDPDRIDFFEDEIESPSFLEQIRFASLQLRFPHWSFFVMNIGFSGVVVESAILLQNTEDDINVVIGAIGLVLAIIYIALTLYYSYWGLRSVAPQKLFDIVESDQLQKIKKRERKLEKKLKKKNATEYPTAEDEYEIDDVFPRSRSSRRRNSSRRKLSQSSSGRKVASSARNRSFSSRAQTGRGSKTISRRSAFTPRSFNGSSSEDDSHHSNSENDGSSTSSSSSSDTHEDGHKWFSRRKSLQQSPMSSRAKRKSSTSGEKVEGELAIPSSSRRKSKTATADDQRRSSVVQMPQEDGDHQKQKQQKEKQDNEEDRAPPKDDSVIVHDGSDVENEEEQSVISNKKKQRSTKRNPLRAPRRKWKADSDTSSGEDLDEEEKDEDVSSKHEEGEEEESFKTSSKEDAILTEDDKPPHYVKYGKAIQMFAKYCGAAKYFLSDGWWIKFRLYNRRYASMYNSFQPRPTAWAPTIVRVFMFSVSIASSLGGCVIPLTYVGTVALLIAIFFLGSRPCRRPFDNFLLALQLILAATLAFSRSSNPELSVNLFYGVIAVTFVYVIHILIMEALESFSMSALELDARDKK